MTSDTTAVTAFESRLVASSNDNSIFSALTPFTGTEISCTVLNGTFRTSSCLPLPTTLTTSILSEDLESLAWPALKVNVLKLLANLSSRVDVSEYPLIDVEIPLTPDLSATS